MDNDIKNQDVDKPIQRAATTLFDLGKRVWIAKPNEPGKDYNDLLKEHGKHHVKSNIDGAIPHKDYVDKHITTHTLRDEMARIHETKEPVLDEKTITKIINKESNLHRTVPNSLIKNGIREGVIQRPNSEQKIENFAKERANKSGHFLSKISDVNQAISAENHQAVTKKRVQIKDIEREI